MPKNMGRGRAPARGEVFASGGSFGPPLAGSGSGLPGKVRQAENGRNGINKRERIVLEDIDDLQSSQESG